MFIFVVSPDIEEVAESNSRHPQQSSHHLPPILKLKPLETPTYDDFNFYDQQEDDIQVMEQAVFHNLWLNATVFEFLSNKHWLGIKNFSSFVLM